MNKYVLIPHEQYQSFKSFLADKKEHKIAESNQETVNEKDIHPKIHDSNSEIIKAEEFRSVDSKILNYNNNNKRKSEKLLGNNRKETVSSQFSDNTKRQDRNKTFPPSTRSSRKSSLQSRQVPLKNKIKWKGNPKREWSK